MQPENKVSSVEKQYFEDKAIAAETWAELNADNYVTLHTAGRNGFHAGAQWQKTQPQPTHTIGIDEDELTKLAVEIKTKEWADGDLDGQDWSEINWFKKGYRLAIANNKAFSLEDIEKAWKGNAMTQDALFRNLQSLSK